MSKNQLIPIDKKRNIIFFAVLLLVLVSCPLFISGLLTSSTVYVNHDLYFHLSRIDGIFNELKNGVFPVRMQTSWENGYGYPVSIYYSDLFLYLPVFLKCIGFGTIAAYKFYVLFINAGTVFISYYCFRKMFSSSEVALIVTFAYTAAPYRLVNIYVRAAVGEYTAMMFFPLIALALYKIYKESSDNFRNIFRNSMLLALGMGGIILSHILSTEIATVFLIIFCLINIKATFKKPVILTYLFAVIETVLITAWFIIPFLDYYFNVDAQINHISASAFSDNDTVSLNSIFSFFSGSGGSSMVGSQMLLTPGLLLAVTLIFSVLLCINKKHNKEIKIVTIMSVIAAAISLNLTWKILNKIPVFDFLSNVQYTFRFLAVLSLLLTVLLGFCLNYLLQNGIVKIKPAFYILIMTVFVCAAFFLSSYKNQCNEVISSSDYTASYDVIGGEYLLTDSRATDTKCTASGVDIIEEKRENGAYVVKCETEGGSGTISFPVYNYKGYAASDASGNEYTINSDENGHVQVVLPADYRGELTLEFIPPWYWRAAEIISTVSMISVFCYVITYCVKAYRLGKSIR